jgi:hypothetical protein
LQKEWAYKRGEHCWPTHFKIQSKLLMCPQCSITQSPIFKGNLCLVLLVIEKFIRIEFLLEGHLSYKNTFSLAQKWPLNTGLTVLTLIVSVYLTRRPVLSEHFFLCHEGDLLIQVWQYTFIKDCLGTLDNQSYIKIRWRLPQIFGKSFIWHPHPKMVYFGHVAIQIKLAI